MITTTFNNGIWRAQASKPSKYENYRDHYMLNACGSTPEHAINALMQGISSFSATKPFEIDYKPFVLDCVYDTFGASWVASTSFNEDVMTIHASAGCTPEQAINALMARISDEYDWHHFGIGDTWIEDDNFGIY